VGKKRALYCSGFFHNGSCDHLSNFHNDSFHHKKSIFELGEQMMIFSGRSSGKTKAIKERIIENHLRFYQTYQVGIKNCEQQLEYIMPTLIARYEVTNDNETSFIVNNTENCALDRIESKRAIDLREEIERYKIITKSIENAMENLSEIEKRFIVLRYFEGKPMQVVTNALGYAEEKSVYRIRRHILDRMVISLNNLLLF